MGCDSTGYSWSLWSIILFQTFVPFVGHIVDRRRLQCDCTMIEDAKTCLVPDGLKSTGYFCWFIRNFVDRAVSYNRKRCAVCLEQPMSNCIWGLARYSNNAPILVSIFGIKRFLLNNITGQNMWLHTIAGLYVHHSITILLRNARWSVSSPCISSSIPICGELGPWCDSPWRNEVSLAPCLINSSSILSLFIGRQGWWKC